MNRILFALAAVLPFAGQTDQQVTQQAPIEVVGPSVLMNVARRQPCVIFDFRPHGRSVPGATRDLQAPIQPGVPVFALGNPEVVEHWAEKRDVKTVQVVPASMIEFENMRGVPQLAPQTAKAKNEEGWPLFDISEQFEFDEQRLPGSQRLNFADFQRGQWDALPKKGPFIVACRVGHRSQLVVKKLRAAGYDARNLCGGLWEWECRDLPLVKK